MAPPRLVSARVCLVESRPARDRSRPWPLAKPACSISQAALVLTVPSGCGQRGAASGRRVRRPRPSRNGLVKNEPALQVSWSAASSTMPLPAAGPAPPARTSASGARSPGSTPRVRASSAYRTGAPRSPMRSWKVDRQHHEPAGLGLEPAGAVAEAAVGVGEGARPTGRRGPRSGRRRWSRRPPGRRRRRSGSGWRRPRPGMPERASIPTQPALRRRWPRSRPRTPPRRP